ncbi:MAG: MerR family transcriptional regulator [Gammaproteobacteria bacterium]
MPIGQFSKSCRLSIKALRHYDEQGLLEPAHVDADTGYRYYSAGQARDAVMIGMLRGLGISVAKVKDILRAEGDGLKRVLELERERLATALVRQQQALRSIERIAREGELMPYEISVRVEPGYTVAQRSCVTTPERLVEESGALVYALFEELRGVGRDVIEPVMCINEDPDREERIVVHACACVQAPYPQLPQARIQSIEGGPVVWLTHEGAYEELGIAYHALYAWAQARGHVQIGPMREIYENDPAHVPAEALRTQVLLPVRE